MQKTLKIWSQSIVFFVVSTMILEESFGLAKMVSSDETAQLIIAALILVPYLLFALWFFGEKEVIRTNLSISKLFSKSTFASLRYSVPIFVSWLPLLFIKPQDGIFIENWIPYLVGNLLHSCLAEELMFRGILFSLFQKRYRFPQAALISSLAFGLIHLNKVVGAETYAQFAFAIIRVFVSIGSGYVLCVLYRKYNFNLWIPILFHFVINGFGFFKASEDIAGISINFAGLAIAFIWIFRENITARYCH